MSSSLTKGGFYVINLPPHVKTPLRFPDPPQAPAPLSSFCSSYFLLGRHIDIILPGTTYLRLYTNPRCNILQSQISSFAGSSLHSATVECLVGDMISSRTPKSSCSAKDMRILRYFLTFKSFETWLQPIYFNNFPLLVEAEYHSQNLNSCKVYFSYFSPISREAYERALWLVLHYLNVSRGGRLSQFWSQQPNFTNESGFRTVPQIVQLEAQLNRPAYTCSASALMPLPSGRMDSPA